MPENPIAQWTNTLNKFGVAARGDKLFMLLPPRGEFSKEDALLLAAWLVALAEYDEDCPEFRRALTAVLAT